MKAGKTLKIGHSDFKEIVENNHYFVDKTLLIQEFYNIGSYISLMPRPRRFGKTLNLSMIEHFFDSAKKGNSKLFSEFKIAEQKDFCQKHQNQYPVINFTLKKIKADNWEECFEGFKITISELYEKYNFLLQSDKLGDYEKEFITNIITRKASLTDYKSSLLVLSKYLHTHYQKNVIILVDEYDTPIIYSYTYTFGMNKMGGNENYYKNTIAFMRTFLGEAFKGNANLEKGLITGIMRVGKESIFSEWNNLSVFSITSNYFSDKFGFTEAETLKLLKYFDLEESFEQIKHWYNGYKFGKTDKIYNPWSIVNYVACPEDGFKPYWVHTSSDALIRERVLEPNVKEKLLELMRGKTVSKKINENFTFSDFDKEKELIWTLLVYSGYLTQVEKAKYDTYKVRIPNHEVLTLFRDIVVYWFEVDVKVQRDLLIAMAESLIHDQKKEFEKHFREIIGDSISYFDTGKSKKNPQIIPEKIYHTYTLGILAILTDDFIIKSNRESGEGRYDIVLIPKDKKDYGIIMEFKQIPAQKKKEKKAHFNKRINKALEEAAEQIEVKNYAQELLSNGLAEDKIAKFPIVFAGKYPYILKV